MLNTNSGSLDPAGRPFFATAQNQPSGNAYLSTGNLSTLSSYPGMQNPSVIRNSLSGPASAGQPPPVPGRFAQGAQGGPLAQFQSVGRGGLGAIPVGLGPIGTLANSSAVNRTQLNVQGLQLNTAMQPIRPGALDQRMTPLNLGLQNTALQQRNQLNPQGFPLVRGMNPIAMGNGPLNSQLNAQMGQTFSMGTSPGRANPVSIHAGGGSGFLGGDGILQALKNSAAPGNSQLSNLGAGAYGVPNQTMQGGTLGQMGLQGQPNLTGADSAILSGFTNADVFMNISKGPGHPKEFSIQNEQEFPALPTSTQPREEQLSSVSDIQSSLQGQAGRHAASLHNIPNGEHVPGIPGSNQLQGVRTPGADASSNPFLQQPSVQSFDRKPQALPANAMMYPQAPSNSEKLPEQYGLKMLISDLHRPDGLEANLLQGLDKQFLALRLKSKEEDMFNTLVSPWSDQEQKAFMNKKVPSCYIHNKIPRLELNHFVKFAHDTLFYIFYSSPGDEVQLFAAEELCKNKWMYHRKRQQWIRPHEGGKSYKQDGLEFATYDVFDQKQWTKSTAELHVTADDIERHPMMVRRQELPPEQAAQQAVHQSALRG